MFGFGMGLVTSDQSSSVLVSSCETEPSPSWSWCCTSLIGGEEKLLVCDIVYHRWPYGVKGGKDETLHKLLV